MAVDRSVIAAVTIGSGVNTAAWLENELDHAELTAAAVADRILHRHQPARDQWLEFLVDAVTAAQLLARAVDDEHDFGTNTDALLRQVADVAAMAAVADITRLTDTADAGDPSRIFL